MIPFIEVYFKAGVNDLRKIIFTAVSKGYPNNEILKKENEREKKRIDKIINMKMFLSIPNKV